MTVTFLFIVCTDKKSLLCGKPPRGSLILLGIILLAVNTRRYKPAVAQQLKKNYALYTTGSDLNENV
jgi:hypothetical protein